MGSLASADGFGPAVPAAGPVFLSFLAVHVLAGMTAVVSGALAATAPKRRGRHTRSGTIYYRAVTVVLATATAMTAMRPARDWYLFLLGALTFALATAGRDSRRHPQGRPWRRWPGHAPHILGMGGSYTVLLTAFYVDNGKNLPLWDRLPTVAYWLLPAVVAAPLIGRALARHRRRPACKPTGTDP
ncbi:MAG: hypothetical protein ACRDP7_45170 [Trebonia sp.]